MIERYGRYGDHEWLLRKLNSDEFMMLQAQKVRGLPTYWADLGGLVGVWPAAQDGVEIVVKNAPDPNPYRWYGIDELMGGEP